MIQIIQISISLLPVFLFLLLLILWDSYKLVRFKSVAGLILLGCVAAIAGFFLNKSLIDIFNFQLTIYSRFIGPFVEEFLKALPIVFLLKRKKVGFLVDAAIYGFAVGSGFAIFENLYYLNVLYSNNIFLWIIRGFGTAIMHGATTSIFAVLLKSFFDRHGEEKIRYLLGAYLLAALIHSLFNQFLFSPVVVTIGQLIALPILLSLIYNRSEQALRNWLEIGLDADVKILESITTGHISETRIGRYLHSLKEQFPGEIVVDMLCYLRLHLELAIRAKGILLMREAGFKAPVDPEIREKFSELRYLDKSLGKTGKLALGPILNTSTRDLWQIYFVEPT